MRTESSPLRLAAHELDLVGTWQLRGEKMIADPVSARIEWLIGEYLVRLSADHSGWNELYRDPDDGRLWELTWPHSGLQGGGPPRLTCVTIEAARSRYGTIVDT